MLNDIYDHQISYSRDLNTTAFIKRGDIDQEEIKEIEKLYIECVYIYLCILKKSPMFLKNSSTKRFSSKKHQFDNCLN